MNFFDLGSYKAEAATEAYELSEDVITELYSVLKAGFCIQLGLSGKDSSSVMNGALEAMKRAIADGVIAQDHPLVVITVDTLLEPEQIQCYIPFAHKTIKQRCEELGINLKIEIVTPPFHQQLMILFASAQKLLATSQSGRTADCSTLWKIDSCVRALKRIKSTLPVKYQNATWVSLSGSRSAESTRRSANMARQGVRSLKANELISNVKRDINGKPGKTYKFAPISDWSTPDVINYLTHAGSNPMASTPVNQRIASYGENFGLLLAIYGESSGNDVCEVVAMDDVSSSEGSGCGKNKIARFGCVVCGMVSENHSAIEAEQYPRWARFGDATRRFRDYLTRVNDDLDCRAFHARAHDPLNNNVFLQPNVLKAKVLEKMVWYAAQITQDSEKTHLDFTDSVNRGEIDLDPGIIDINNDATLSVSVRKQYIQMYTERMLQGPMFELFTDKHAVLLSLLWSLHGVATVPYRPIAILDAVKSGKRLPYPMTNRELDAKRAVQGLMSVRDELNAQELPDALVAKLFTPSKVTFAELKSIHGENLVKEHLEPLLPFTLSDYWVRKDVQFDALGGVLTHVETRSLNVRRFKLHYELNTANSTENIKAKCMLTGKQIDTSKDAFLLEQLLELGRKNYSEELIRSARQHDLSEMEMVNYRSQLRTVFSVESIEGFNNQLAFTSGVHYLSSQLKTKPKATNRRSARKRVYDKSTSSYIALRASLKTYKAADEAASYQQSAQKITYWLPDESMSRVCSVGVSSSIDLFGEEMDLKFIFDEEIYDHWLAAGGWTNAINLHNGIIQSRIVKRLPLRVFFDTQPVYTLTNNAGLTVAGKYIDYMHTTLKRTEVYATAGLFSLAGLSYKKIAAFPNVMTMAEHRQQKVQNLLAHRHLLNKQRNLVKQSNVAGTENQMAFVNVTARFNEFVTQYKSIATKYLAVCMLAPFGDNAVMRSKKLLVWLNEFGSVFHGVDEMLSLLATKEERETIGSNYDCKKMLASALNQSVNSISVDLNNEMEGPAKMMAKLAALADYNEAVKCIQSTGYQAHSEAGVLVDEIAGWVTKQAKGFNAYLVGFGMTQALAHMSNLDYVDPVFTVSESANSSDKKQLRCGVAKNIWANSSANLTLSSHTCFDPITNPNTQQHYARNASAKQSAKVLSSKLALLMSGEVNKLTNLCKAS
jgi:3'-phosphoadenosine 5'-phosphosulfate sulfotransferase (PAPS reductase)/FAD synthetase